MSRKNALDTLKYGKNWTILLKFPPKQENFSQSKLPSLQKNVISNYIHLQELELTGFLIALRGYGSRTFRELHYLEVGASN